MNDEPLNARVLRWCLTAGYYATDDGSIIGPRGKRKLQRDKSGYFRFTVRPPFISPKTRTVLVHRFVAFQKFGGAALLPNIQVRHMDGNQLNNRPSNLELGTAVENHFDKPADARHNQVLMAAKRRVRLSRSEMDKLRSERNLGLSYRELAAKYSVSLGTAHRVVNTTYSSLDECWPSQLDDRCGSDSVKP